jgi:methionine biosynthesis protein MetW
MPEIEAQSSVVAYTDYSTSFNSFVFNEIPSNSSVLDVGCATGNLGEALIKQKNCKVDGMETNPKAAQAAKQRGYGNVFDVNLDYQLNSLTGLENKYDVIVCADVLEHLVSPETALHYLQKFLKPGGKVVISFPNVAFLLNRLNLLLGRWNYKEYGILDKTHLRFYTLKSGARMVETTGLKVLEVKPYNQFGMLRYLKPLDSWFPGLLAFQFIIVAQKS